MFTRLSPLQAAEIAAARYGFFDVDLVDNDIGRFTIRATGHNKSVTARGETLEQAVTRMLEVFAHG